MYHYLMVIGIFISIPSSACPEPEIGHSVGVRLWRKHLIQHQHPSASTQSCLKFSNCVQKSCKQESYDQDHGRCRQHLPPFNDHCNLSAILAKCAKFNENKEIPVSTKLKRSKRNVARVLTHEAWVKDHNRTHVQHIIEKLLQRGRKANKTSMMSTTTDNPSESPSWGSSSTSPIPVDSETFPSSTTSPSKQLENQEKDHKLLLVSIFKATQEESTFAD